MVERAILTCSCHNQDQKAKEAFSLLFPGDPMPDIIRGRDRIYKLSQELGGHEHIKAISRLGGKFAYYIELEDDTIIKEVDLTTGKRIG